MRVKCFAQETTQCFLPVLEPGPLTPESSALTMRPPRLPNIQLVHVHVPIKITQC